MTVNELSKLAKSQIEVRSGYDGRMLCKAFNSKRHSNIAEREVTSVWTEIRVINGGGYDSFARPVICVFVYGDAEYDYEPMTGPDIRD